MSLNKCDKVHHHTLYGFDKVPTFPFILRYFNMHNTCFQHHIQGYTHDIYICKNPGVGVSLV